MALIVQKYGGSSVGTPERVRAVAKRVAELRGAGHEVVVVVSAMGDTTDDLLQLATAVTGHAVPGARHPREVDMLLTAGERISMALLAMAICEHGAEAVSLTGSQAAIITDGTHTAARIREIRADRVREALALGRVVIVAGFQGVSAAREVTTLGRGGSDTSAVAIAAAIGADQCQIFTDVDGVFTADPRRVPGARVVPEIGYEEMIELAAAGAQVMHPRAVEIAARHGVDVRVLSSFVEDDAAAANRRGTLITRTPRRMEALALSGITATDGQAKLTLRDLPRGLRTPTRILNALADAGISVDTIAEAEDKAGRVQIQLTIAESQLDEALAVLGSVRDAMGGAQVEAHRGLTRVVLVGSGMHNRPGVYARTFSTLLDAEIEVHAISTSSVSITLVVPTERADDTVRGLHDAFTLEQRGDAPAAG
jgi:aspartate kinase